MGTGRECRDHGLTINRETKSADSLAVSGCCAHAKKKMSVRRAALSPLLTFDEFVGGTEIFGKCIQPLMQCRRHVTSAARVAA